LAIGVIRPQEVQATNGEDPQAIAAQDSADVLIDQVQHTPAGNQQSGSAALRSGSAAPSTSATASPTPAPPTQGVNLDPIFEEEEAEGEEEKKKVLSIQNYAKSFNGITLLTTSLEASEGG
jgi:hypothetical protein